MNSIDTDHLQQWVGRARTSSDSLSLFPAQALAALLNHERAPTMDAALAPAWHWLYFLESPFTSDTGPDGHPKIGGFLPPISLQRRMWAAGDMEIVQALKIGHTAVRTTTIKSVDTKIGRTGKLVFVTLEHQLSQYNRVCVREEQNLVYRERPSTPTLLPVGESAPTDAEWTRVVRPDPVLLFRFSALTYNGHRIHYDRPYAIEQEHYPALVVQGPLLAILLLDLLRAHVPDARVTRFCFRALRPFFDITHFTLNGQRHGDGATLWTTDHEGHIGMSASAVLS